MLRFYEIKGIIKSTYTDAFVPIDRQLMQQVEIELPEEVKKEREQELSRVTIVNVYPHPQLAEIAGNQMKKGYYTDLVSGYLPTKSFKKIRENELKGRPFPVKDFQIPKRKGR
ncbi:MAG: hypothetical protein AAB600_01890 [Patescibacteria group bacterium]